MVVQTMCISHTNTHTRTRTHIHIPWMCVWMCVWMYVYIYIYIYIYIYTLRDKVTLWLLKLYIADVTEWSRALDIRLSDWCCSIAMVWVQIPFRENKKVSAQKSYICVLRNIIRLLFSCCFFQKEEYKYIWGKIHLTNMG